MKKAFTLLELVFVILILGILASLSFSFANQNKNDAKLLKLKIDYEMLNSALSLMRTQVELKQISSFSPNLDEAKINTQKEKLFTAKLVKIAPILCFIHLFILVLMLG
ncbi:type II secretion system protein [Campylobacter coli]